MRSATSAPSRALPRSRWREPSSGQRRWWRLRRPGHGPLVPAPVKRRWPRPQPRLDRSLCATRHCLAAQLSQDLRVLDVHGHPGDGSRRSVSRCRRPRGSVTQASCRNWHGPTRAKVGHNGAIDAKGPNRPLKPRSTARSDITGAPSAMIARGADPAKTGAASPTVAADTTLTGRPPRPTTTPHEGTQALPSVGHGPWPDQAGSITHGKTLFSGLTGSCR